MLCLTSVQVVSSAAESLSRGEWDPGMSHVGEQMLGKLSANRIWASSVERGVQRSEGVTIRISGG